MQEDSVLVLFLSSTESLVRYVLHCLGGGVLEGEEHEEPEPMEGFLDPKGRGAVELSPSLKGFRRFSVAPSSEDGAFIKWGFRSLEEGGCSWVVVIDGHEKIHALDPRPMLELLQRRKRDVVAVEGRAQRVSGPVNELFYGWGGVSVGVALVKEALEGVPLHRTPSGDGFLSAFLEQLSATRRPAVVVEVPALGIERESVWTMARHAAKKLSLRTERRAHELGLRWSPLFDLDAVERYPTKRFKTGSHHLLAERVPPSSTVLDVGCGGGGLAQMLKDKGCVVDGVDVHIDGGYRRDYRFLWERDLDEGFGDDICGPYDVLLLADVLEHLKAPERILEACHALLSPGGKVVASTGNVAHWFVRTSLLMGEFNPTPRGILDRTHLHLYTRHTFRKLLEGEGYHVVGEEFTPLPVEEILGDNAVSSGRVGRGLEWAQRWHHRLARLWPGLVAYQIILEAVEKRAGEAEISQVPR